MLIAVHSAIRIPPTVPFCSVKGRCNFILKPTAPSKRLPVLHTMASPTQTNGKRRQRISPKITPGTATRGGLKRVKNTATTSTRASANAKQAQRTQLRSAAASASASSASADEAKIVRCGWCLGSKDPDTLQRYIRYHDEEWGVPVRGKNNGLSPDQDAKLFEMLTLEGAQILNKREGYRNAFEQFDPAKVAKFTSKDIERLVKDERIVRHRGKIESTVNNAKMVLEVQKEHGSLSAYLWGFLPNGKPIQTQKLQSWKELPSKTELSEHISKALKNKGFRFVGPTTVYAFMQATGMVNDHMESCFRHPGQQQQQKG